jgi:PTH1 family peptidyl-tRNA hydrolase
LRLNIQLIVGLGNPGAKYEQTRHNVGFWFVDHLAQQESSVFRSENKFHGDITKLTIAGVDVWLLKPMTFMNNSGQSIGAVSRFYKIPPQAMLLIHDELDLPSGTARLKKSGGHGGHNGLRDTIAHLGVNDFNRLRIGIDHPGNSREVSDFVLTKPSKEQRIGMDVAIDNALQVIPDVIKGEWQQAMHNLHSK